MHHLTGEREQKRALWCSMAPNSRDVKSMPGSQGALLCCWCYSYSWTLSPSARFLADYLCRSDILSVQPWVVVGFATSGAINDGVFLSPPVIMRSAGYVLSSWHWLPPHARSSLSRNWYDTCSGCHLHARLRYKIWGRHSVYGNWHPQLTYCSSSARCQDSVHLVKYWTKFVTELAFG